MTGIFYINWFAGFCPSIGFSSQFVPARPGNIPAFWSPMGRSFWGTTASLRKLFLNSRWIFEQRKGHQKCQPCRCKKWPCRLPLNLSCRSTRLYEHMWSSASLAELQVLIAVFLLFLFRLFLLLPLSLPYHCFHCSSSCCCCCCCCCRCCFWRSPSCCCSSSFCSC